MEWCVFLAVLAFALFALNRPFHNFEKGTEESVVPSDSLGNSRKFFIFIFKFSVTRIPQSLAIARLILEVGLTSTFLRPVRAEPINCFDSAVIT